MKLHELNTRVTELMSDVISGPISPNAEVLIINELAEVQSPTALELETEYDVDGDGQRTAIASQTLWIRAVDR